MYMNLELICIYLNHYHQNQHNKHHQYTFNKINITISLICSQTGNSLSFNIQFMTNILDPNLSVYNKHPYPYPQD